MYVYFLMSDFSIFFLLFFRGVWYVVGSAMLLAVSLPSKIFPKYSMDGDKIFRLNEKGGCLIAFRME